MWTTFDARIVANGYPSAPSCCTRIFVCAITSSARKVVGRCFRNARLPSSDTGTVHMILVTAIARSRTRNTTRSSTLQMYYDVPSAERQRHSLRCPLWHAIGHPRVRPSLYSAASVTLSCRKRATRMFRTLKHYSPGLLLMNLPTALVPRSVIFAARLCACGTWRPTSETTTSIASHGRHHILVET